MTMLLDVMIRFGGSYNLRESEGKHPHAQKVNLNDNCANEATGQCINCSVFFLDDTESNFQVTVTYHQSFKVSGTRLFRKTRPGKS